MHQFDLSCATRRPTDKATSLSHLKQRAKGVKKIIISSNKMANAGNNNKRKQRPVLMMNTSSRLVWWICCIVAGLVVLALGSATVECQEQLTVESRQAKEQAASENELADTIKYLEKLEKLDKYWSEVARPRFGRSEYRQPALMGARSGLVAKPPPMRLIKTMSAEPRVGSLAELINSRLAQRYNSNEAY